MRGYQYLENDFFNLCKTRKITRTSMLLYIYLRGLYCRFQKPAFTWEDKKILDHLGITHPTLRNCRETLTERGVLLFKSGNGAKHPTQYTLLGSVLLPELKVKNSFTKGEKNLHLPRKKLSPSTYTSKERDKKRIGIFKGMAKEDREQLKRIGIL